MYSTGEELDDDDDDDEDDDEGEEVDDDDDDEDDDDYETSIPASAGSHCQAPGHACGSGLRNGKTKHGGESLAHASHHATYTLPSIPFNS
jgi:hypothetical protein